MSRGGLMWFGGKGLLAGKIVPLLPKHEIYVEPFGGGAAVLLAKPPSPMEVYNDIDSSVVNYFRVVRDKETFAEFQRLVSLTPYSREEYKDAVATWQDEIDPIKKAALWFITNRQSISGHKSWGFSTHNHTYSRGMAQAVFQYISAIENLADLTQRLMTVQIENRDYLEIFDAYDSQDTLFYCDPPYLISKRRSGNYLYDFTRYDHNKLLERLLNLKGKAVLSCYDHALYAPLLVNGWRRYEFKTIASGVPRTVASKLKGKGQMLKNQSRQDVLWIKD